MMSPELVVSAVKVPTAVLIFMPVKEKSESWPLAVMVPEPVIEAPVDSRVNKPLV